MYNTVIFDLDGTLLNTLEDLKDSLNYALTQHGYKTRTLEEVRRFVGNGVQKLVERALPEGTSEEEMQKCLDTFKKHYQANMQNKTRPYDGIKELLTELKKNNYKTAIVSNKFDAAVKELATDYFGDLIDVAIGESATVKKKPAPDTVFAALKELGSDLSEAIFVGDSETDVRTAKNAGLPCVGVTWGFRSRDVLINERADYIIDTPERLLEILKK